ncbi:MAG: rhomboid family intramembrane serine protease [Bacteroidales bacterium]|nr:rhomboid family intramembrane serine protease [Bacteroidales bacterium]MBN2762600.1 rhomboid family intramembrane serine protease [Bacteroidales bacterium]
MSSIGTRSPLAMPPVTKSLLIITVIVYLISWAVEQFLHSDIMIRYLALFRVQSPLFFPTQLLTHIFMHGNLTHLFFNMFGLYMFGRILENVWGTKKMLIFYLATGIGAALIQSGITYWQMHKMINLAEAFIDNPSYMVFSKYLDQYLLKGSTQYSEIMSFAQSWFYAPDNMSVVPKAVEYTQHILYENLNIPMVGASGAIFGLLAAFAMIFPDVELMLIFLPIPIKAKYFVPVYAVIELIFGVAGFSWDNVAHFAHLGGALVGFILVKYWRRNQFKIY